MGELGRDSRLLLVYTSTFPRDNLEVDSAIYRARLAFCPVLFSSLIILIEAQKTSEIL